MTATDNRFAPYAPPANVIGVIQRFRSRGLPDKLDNLELVRLGCASGNASRVLQAFKFLGLVDDEGHKTATFQRLGRASSDEYPEILAEILTAAYSPVFTILDPAEATDVQIEDAFRYYQPEGQRNRMITMFTGLCREANIINATRSAARQSPAKHTVPKKTQKPANTQPTQEQQPRIHQPNLFTDADTAPHYIPQPQKFKELIGLLDRLPNDCEWTDYARNKWLLAFTSTLDLIIDRIPESGLTQKREYSRNFSRLP